MKANVLLRNAYGLLGLFIVTFLFLITSANAQTLASVGSTPNETTFVSSPTLEKGTMHGEDMYVAKNGTIFKKGDKIQLGTAKLSNRFEFVEKLDQYDSKLINKFNGFETTIQKIKQQRVSGKNSPLITYLVITVGYGEKYYINVEDALTHKELIAL